MAAGGGFDDGKDENALRTIGEVGAALAIKPHVLRYWEQQFAALQPLKRSGGRRYYRPEDIRLLRDIDRLLNREGYTIKGARAALAKSVQAAGEGKPAGTGEATPEGKNARSRLAEQLRVIRDRLAKALDE